MVILDYDSTGSSSWPSFAPFKVIVYLRYFAESLNAQRFQRMPARGDSRTVYDARYAVNRNTGIGAWNKR